MLYNHFKEKKFSIPLILYLISSFWIFDVKKLMNIPQFITLGTKEEYYSIIFGGLISILFWIITFSFFYYSVFKYYNKKYVFFNEKKIMTPKKQVLFKYKKSKKIKNSLKDFILLFLTIVITFTIINILFLNESFYLFDYRYIFQLNIFVTDHRAFIIFNPLIISIFTFGLLFSIFVLINYFIKFSNFNLNKKYFVYFLVFLFFSIIHSGIKFINDKYHLNENNPYLLNIFLHRNIEVLQYNNFLDFEIKTVNRDLYSTKIYKLEKYYSDLSPINLNIYDNTPNNYKTLAFSYYTLEQMIEHELKIENRSEKLKKMFRENIIKSKIKESKNLLYYYQNRKPYLTNYNSWIEKEMPELYKKTILYKKNQIEMVINKHKEINIPAINYFLNKQYSLLDQYIDNIEKHTDYTINLRRKNKNIEYF